MAIRIGSEKEISEHIAELHQSIRVLGTTQKGSVPHQHELGVDWLASLDLPFARAVPLLVASVEDCLRRFEPRVTVRRVQAIPHETEVGRAVVRVTWVPKRFEAADEQTTEVPVDVAA